MDSKKNRRNRQATPDFPGTVAIRMLNREHIIP